MPELFDDAETLRLNLAISVALSVLAYTITRKLIPAATDLLFAAGLKSRDLHKRDHVEVAESAGVISGSVFLVSLMVFTSVVYHNDLFNLANTSDLSVIETAARHDVAQSKLIVNLAFILALCCMLLLGFADDVLKLRLQYKLLLPMIATLPLVTVTMTGWWKSGDSRLDVLETGLACYLCTMLLAVLCTTSISILAGVNGVEVGHSAMIATSLIVINLAELANSNGSSRNAAGHWVSLCILLPYASSTLALLGYNWYPSRVFAGNAFCYYSGMTFATVALVTGFDVTQLLLFLPHLCNLLYSLPQLLGVIPCPDHRMPHYDPQTDCLTVSWVRFHPAGLSSVGRFCLSLLKLLRLLRVEDDTEEKTSGQMRCNNLTLLNLVLLVTGPLHERTLTLLSLGIQLACTCLAFLVRYYST